MVARRIVEKIRAAYWKRCPGRCRTCAHYVPVWFRAESVREMWGNDRFEGWRNYGCGRCMKKNGIPFAGGETAACRGCRKWEQADDAPWRSYKPGNQERDNGSGNKNKD